MTKAPTSQPLVYQGSTDPWECDEGGHLNVRFHVERAMTGLAHMARALDMERAFAQGAGATLLPTDMHVRFLKEALPGAPLSMRGAVLAFNETSARFCLDMRHAGGEPASAFSITAAHADPRTGKPFAWSSRSRGAAPHLIARAPEHAAPRSIDVDRAPGEASLARARALGARCVGVNCVRPADCDAFGRMRPELYFGFASDGAPHLLADWRKALAKDTAATPAGAVLEARVVFRAWPRAGDLIEAHSALVAIEEKINRLVHWLLDPHSGEAWASVEIVGLTFDLATRKAIAPSSAARAAFANHVVAAMTI